MSKQQLIDLVLKQIQKDVDNGDLTAIETLLAGLKDKDLKAFLSEGV